LGTDFLTKHFLDIRNCSGRMGLARKYLAFELKKLVSLLVIEDYLRSSIGE
jgi:hypothetical protein